MKLAVVPGSFDPVTLGHVDIIRRAAVLFDKVVVAAMINSEKQYHFTAEERIQFLKDAVEDLPNGADILDVADLVEAYGIEKGKWPMGKWVPPTPLSADIAKQLGLDASTATRTDVLNAAKKADLMKVFDAYNIGYNRGLALQHNCEGIINSDGSVTPL